MDCAAKQERFVLKLAPWRAEQELEFDDGAVAACELGIG
jgi:hypothetical protein